ncbi:hypothetical protein WA026_013009 [Henosepilachna vigintioctopunctata]|uniref:Proton-coupled folate transporter n=1 Tax=Henosepilachna vigintioctopunctata TaxID=420089 RepID=A0AAW1TMY3_9CUCU
MSDEISNEKPQRKMKKKLKNLETEQKRGIIKKIFSELTVEPLILVFCFSSTMHGQTTQNLYLEKTCRVHLAYNVSVCDAMSDRTLGGYTEEQEAEVQKYVSKLVGIATFIQGFFSVSLILFLGSWSDRHSLRKPLILIPMLGELTALCLLILNTIFFEEIPVIFTAISASLPAAITGGFPCLFLGIYSYVSSISHEDDKTARIGACTAVQNIGVITGLASSGLLLNPLSFLGVYSTCFILFLFSLLYGYWKIEDINLHADGKIQEKSGEQCFFSDFFSMKHFFNTLKICFKKGPNKRRQKIIVIMMLTVVALGAAQGEGAVLYLYTRFKFGFSEFDFSIFFVLHSMVDVIGSFISLGFLSKYLEWKDASLGIISLITTIICNLTYAFVPTSKYFYAAMILDIFYETPLVAIRSLLAKTVPAHEIGQANSILGVCEALMPSLFGPLYTTVYEHSILYLPGSYYLVSFGLNSIGVLFFIWLYRQTKDNVYLNDEEKGLNQTQDLEAQDI